MEWHIIYKVCHFASSWKEMDDILSVRRDFSAAFEDVRQAKPEDFKDVIRRYKKRNEDPYHQDLVVTKTLKKLL